MTDPTSGPTGANVAGVHIPPPAGWQPPAPPPRGTQDPWAMLSPRPSATERNALAEMKRLMRQARGDHPALAAVRAEIAARIDALLEDLRAASVDVDALQDQIDTELDNETTEDPRCP